MFNIKISVGGPADTNKTERKKFIRCLIYLILEDGLRV